MRPRSIALLLAACTALAAFAAQAALVDAWRAVPVNGTADDLPALLQALESRSARGSEAASAAFARGQFHYARGEYAQALIAFDRAANQTSGSERGEVRYWQGLTRLGLAEPSAAREAFTEAARNAPVRRSLARLGIAQALEAEGRAPLAFDELQKLLTGDAGEAGPAALAAFASLAERTKHPIEARQARGRLLREYPGSVEAARWAAAPVVPAQVPVDGPIGFSVQLGAFADMTRADALAKTARKAGFSGAGVSQRPSEPGRPALFVVHLGRYPDAAQARAALDKAERALGVSGRVVAR
ncbi:MAG: SPOR domain-containing protein [Candidatus Eisenbacteria bacterium]